MAELAPEIVLDGAVSALLAGRRIVIPVSAGDRDAAIRMGDLVAVARILKELPSADFRRRLGEEIAREASRVLEKRGGTMATIEMEAVHADSGEGRREGEAAALSPYLIVRNAAEALDFYRRAFGATEVMRLAEPSGRIGHAQMRLGGAFWMLADEYPEYGTRAPESPGASGVSMHLSVPDVDAFVERAASAGATVVSPPKDQFYGDRSSRLVDPYGHAWTVSTHKENVAPEELKRRFENLLAAGPSAGTPPAPRQTGPRPGFHAVTPYLTVRRPADLIEFVQRAFGAVELYRGTGSAGGTHAEVRIGDSMVMIGGMESLEKESPATIYLYVPDVDAAYERAIAAGAESLLPPTDQPYGDRNAWVADPFGNTWYIASHLA